jgi:hypothetical protein
VCSSALFWPSDNRECLFYSISGGYDRIVSIAKAKDGFIEPMLALAVTKLREGPAWSYELKFDDQPLHH